MSLRLSMSKFISLVLLFSSVLISGLFGDAEGVQAPGKKDEDCIVTLLYGTRITVTMNRFSRKITSKVEESPRMPLTPSCLTSLENNFEKSPINGDKDSRVDKGVYIIYGTNPKKAELLQSCAQEVGSVFLEYDWEDFAKKYSAGRIEKLFDQVKNDCTKISEQSKKDNLKFVLLIKNVDEIVESPTLCSIFMSTLQKERGNDRDLVFLSFKGILKMKNIDESLLDGLVGTFPEDFRYIINQLKRSDVALKAGQPLPEPVCKNRLLLQGPPGNGKTTMAKKLAEKAGAHVIYRSAPELLSSLHGGTVAAVKAVFDEARAYKIKNNQPVVIIFDEIDALAANVESEQRAEVKAALQTLWTQLDSIEEDAGLFFICTTNNEKLHPTFKVRFANHIITIGAPDEITRRKVLQFYKKKCTGTPWDEAILKELVDGSSDKKMSIRFLKDFVDEVWKVAVNDFDGVITDILVRKIFYEMKTKYIEGKIEKLQKLACKHGETAVRVAAVSVQAYFAIRGAPVPVPVPA